MEEGGFLNSHSVPWCHLWPRIFVNFFIWGKHSSGAIPFTSMLSMGAMWFGISFPLIYIGYYFGFRKAPYQQPVRTNQIPRQVSGRDSYYLLRFNWVWCEALQRDIKIDGLLFFPCFERWCLIDCIICFFCKLPMYLEKKYALVDIKCLNIYLYRIES